MAGVTENRDNDIKKESILSCCYTPWCDPRSEWFRVLMVCLLLPLSIGTFFCYNTPGGLQNIMKEDMLLTNTEFTLLYSVYSWPNVVFVTIGGYVVDNYLGIRLSLILYDSFVLIGHLIFAFGALGNVYWIMIVGRMIFGIGVECFQVSLSNITVLYFKNKDLNFVFGLELLAGRAGCFLSLYTIEPLYQYYKQIYRGPTIIGVILLITGISCVIGLGFAITTAVLDWRVEVMLNREQIKPEFNIKYIKSFGVVFWLATTTTMFFYITLFPFISISKEFFIRYKGMSANDANTLSGIIYMACAVANPFLGIGMDYGGKYMIWIFTSLVGALATFIFLAFTPLNVYISAIFFGLSYAQFTGSMWPCISYIVAEKHLGTAYGILHGQLNFGLAISNIVTGQIVDDTGENYTIVNLFLLSSILISVIGAILMWIFDNYYKGYLNKSPKEMEKFHEIQLAEPTQ